MDHQPVIGLLADRESYGARIEDPSRPERGRWAACLRRAGGDPRPMSPSTDDGQQRRLLDGLDGFVLISQRDVPLTPTGTPAARDVPELSLVRLAAQRRLPFLGIGLGLQLLNLDQGGTLFRLDSVAGVRAGHRHPHNPRHVLWTTPGSLMRQLYGDGRTMVPSLHEAAIERVAPGFDATARCSAGIVEAIESAVDHWFAVGLQFSPDPDLTADLDQRLFEAFLDEVVAQERVRDACAVP